MNRVKIIDNLLKETTVQQLRIDNLDICLMDFLVERVANRDTTIYNLVIKDADNPYNIVDKSLFGTAFDIARQLTAYEARANYITMIYILNEEWYILAEY